MKSSAHQLLSRIVMLLAMAGLTGNFVDLQAQDVPSKLAGTDRIPPGLLGHADDARQPPRGQTNQADLVQILSQRGVSVDAQALAANRGQRRLSGARRVPSEMEIPREDRTNRNQPTRPSRSALLQRLRQLPGGAARLDAARRRGAPIGTSTGQAPLRLDSGDSYGLAYDDLAASEGLTSAPLAGENLASQTSADGDWSTFLYPPSRWSDDSGNRVSMTGASVYSTGSNSLVIRVYKDGCASMILQVPADGWYIVFYTMQIQSGAKLDVTTGFMTTSKLNEFTGDGAWHAYPTLVEMQAGFHLVRACSRTAGKSARFLWSGAYDLP